VEVEDDNKEVTLACEIELAMHASLDGVSAKYKSKYMQLSFNLKDPKNPDLRRKVVLGEITPAELISASPEELASDAKKEENQRIREKKLFDSAPSSVKRATTDQFQCGKCRQRKCTYYQMQTRSADEPMTTFVQCTNCNNAWKFC
jgi:transcription elongation factor S-II